MSTLRRRSPVPGLDPRDVISRTRTLTAPGAGCHRRKTPQGPTPQQTLAARSWIIAGGLLRVEPWVSLGFSRGLREEGAHEWTKSLATARRACKLARLVLANRQGESHRTLAFVAVVFVHGHRGSSDSPAPRSVTRTKPSK